MVQEEPVAPPEPEEPRRAGGLAEALERARAEAKPTETATAAPPPPPPPAPTVSGLRSPVSGLRIPRFSPRLGPRFRHRAALALLVVGVLLLAEVALTALWKEPLTAYLTAGAQSDLTKQLDKLDRSSGRGAVPALARALDARIQPGDAVGRVHISRINIDFVIVQGTGGASLRKGPGHYLGTALPGEGQTVGIAGHRTTYEAPFRNIDQLRPGDRIDMRMPYGVFTYSVQYHRIVKPGAKVFGPAGYDRLVLSACHPLFSASHRIVVFARLVSMQPLNAAPPAPGARRPTPGAAGSASAAAQRRVAKRLAALGSSTLSNGSGGPQVALLQRLLGMPSTGYYGNDTTAAVKDFQRTHHLPMTGRADAATKRALAHRLHPPALPPTPASVAPAVPQQQKSGAGAGTSSGSSGTSGGGQSQPQSQGGTSTGGASQQQQGRSGR